MNYAGQTKIKCILFDMDGVIVDSEPGSFEIFKKTLGLLGINIVLEELLRFIGKTSYTIAFEIIKKYNLKMTPEELLKENRKTGNYYTDYEDMKPMDGFIDFIKLLKNNRIKTAVVSSTSSKNVLAVLNRLSLVKYFDAIMCGDMIKETKPSPEGYLKAAQLLGVKPEECIVIEDSPLGIKAGNNAYMYVIGYKGSLYQQDTSEAAMEVNSFEELKNLCLRTRKNSHINMQQL